MKKVIYETAWVDSKYANEQLWLDDHIKGIRTSNKTITSHQYLNKKDYIIIKENGIFWLYKYINEVKVKKLTEVLFKGSNILDISFKRHNIKIRLYIQVLPSLINLMINKK